MDKEYRRKDHKRQIGHSETVLGVKRHIPQVK